MVNLIGYKEKESWQKERKVASIEIQFNTNCPIKGRLSIQNRWVIERTGFKWWWSVWHWGKRANNDDECSLASSRWRLFTRDYLMLSMLVVYSWVKYSHFFYHLELDSIANWLEAALFKTAFDSSTQFSEKRRVFNLLKILLWGTFSQKVHRQSCY